MSAAGRWRDELAAWAIPDELLRAAAEPPWGFPVALFRAGDEHPTEGGESRRVALEALAEAGNGRASVLDVGCGGGAASLRLVPPASLVVGLDESEAMLTEYSETAATLGVEHRTICGSWPEAAADAPLVDVVVCHHVAYNVPELAIFAAALGEHARRRVVMELTARHPLVATVPLWQQFHGLDRPGGPDADLAREVLAEAGIQTEMLRWQKPARKLPRDVLVTFTRRRLCLPADRDADVDSALGPQSSFPDRDAVTIYWDTAGC